MDFNLDIFFKQHPECLSDDFDIMESLRMARKYMPKSRITDLLFKKKHKPKENLQKCITYPDMMNMTYFNRKPNLLKKIETYLIDTFKGERKKWKDYCLPPIRRYFTDYLFIKSKVFQRMRDLYERRETENSPLVSIYLSGLKEKRVIPFNLLRPLSNSFTLDNMIELVYYINPYILLRERVMSIADFHSVCTFFPYWYFLDQLLEQGIEPNPGPCVHCGYPMKGDHSCSHQLYFVRRWSGDVKQHRCTVSCFRRDNVGRMCIHFPLFSSNSFFLDRKEGSSYYRHHILETLMWDMEDESDYIFSRRAKIVVTKTSKDVPEYFPPMYIEGGSGMMDGNVNIDSQIISRKYKIMMISDDDRSFLFLGDARLIDSGSSVEVYPGLKLELVGSLIYIQLIAEFDLKVYYRNPDSPAFDGQIKLSLRNN